MSKPIIEVTKNAWKKMGSIIQSKTLNGNNFHKSFLFGVSSGGCNGFNFELKLIDDKEFITTDTKVNLINTIKSPFCDSTKLFIDPVSEMYVIGTTIDYINEDYSKGIFESKFTFNISKEIASSCGCGVSFRPKNI
jgi:iron-sulfur cluster assembly accessory protein